MTSKPHSGRWLRVQLDGILQDAEARFRAIGSGSELSGEDAWSAAFLANLRDAVAGAESIEEQLESAMDCMNYAWTIICNVSEGDWTKQRQEWQDAAARCGDQYHALLDSNPAKRPT